MIEIKKIKVWLNQSQFEVLERDEDAHFINKIKRIKDNKCFDKFHTVEFFNRKVNENCVNIIVGFYDDLIHVLIAKYGKERKFEGDIKVSINDISLADTEVASIYYKNQDKICNQ